MVLALSRAPFRPAALGGGAGGGAIAAPGAPVFVVPVELGEKLVRFLEILYPPFPILNLLR